MTINVSQFRTRFPEFSSEEEFSNERIELFIEDSVLIHMGDDPRRWNGKYEYAQAYLVAHLLRCAVGSEAGDGNAAVGPVVSKTVAGVSVTRGYVASPNSSDYDNFLLSSKYGQVFLTVRNSCFIGVAVATCP